MGFGPLLPIPRISEAAFCVLSYFSPTLPILSLRTATYICFKQGTAADGAAPYDLIRGGTQWRKENLIRT